MAGTTKKPRVIEQGGPIGVIVTTTALSLHPEIETRLLSLTVDDSAEQTRRVLRAAADEAQGRRAARPDYAAWHALQGSLALHRDGVVIPFADALANEVELPPTRLRRDFKQVLGLIMAHGLLHAATRAKNSRGAIVATVDDYAAVYALTDPLLTDAAHAAVSPQTRETVETLAALVKRRRGADNAVSSTELARALGLDKSTISRRLAEAKRQGYIANLEARAGMTNRLVLAEPLPSADGVLPSPDRIRSVARLRVAPTKGRPGSKGRAQ
jgi:hypothetical protein